MLRKFDCFSCAGKKFVFLGLNSNITNLSFLTEEFWLLDDYLHRKISTVRLYDIDAEVLNSNDIESFVYNLILPMSFAAIVKDFNFNEPMGSPVVVPITCILFGQIKKENVDKKIVESWYIKNKLQNRNIPDFVDVEECLSDSSNKIFLETFAATKEQFVSARKHYMPLLFLDKYQNASPRTIDIWVDENYYYFVQARTEQVLTTLPATSTTDNIVTWYVILWAYSSDYLKSDIKESRGNMIRCYEEI